MTEQRLVPLELLREILRQIPDCSCGCESTITKRLRAIIDGAEVDFVATAIESVASWIESQRNETPATGEEFAAAIRSEFKFYPQQPSK